MILPCNGLSGFGRSYEDGYGTVCGGEEGLGWLLRVFVVSFGDLGDGDGMIDVQIFFFEGWRGFVVHASGCRGVVVGVVGVGGGWEWWWDGRKWMLLLLLWLRME